MKMTTFYLLLEGCQPWLQAEIEFLPRLLVAMSLPLQFELNPF